MLIYVPAAQTVVPSQTQAVAPELGALPVPQTTAGEPEPRQTYPEGQAVQALAALFTI